MNYLGKKFSRRQIIKFMALGATVPIVNVSSLIGQAQAAKAAKEVTKYRDEPNGEEQCSKCMQFIPGKTPEEIGRASCRERV